MRRIIIYWARLRGLIYSLKSLSGANFHLRLYKELRISSSRIRFGKGVVIYYNARIEAIIFYEGINYNPIIEFGNNVTIQQNIHLTCAQHVTIGQNTAIAANVTITDINHPYENIKLPIDKQRLKVFPVKIGNDCKIYNNAVILPGVTIGNHCVIGANSVVNQNIPDYSIVAGTPARIIKRFDFSTQNWRKTNQQGEFID